jgi:hypothetical protein
MMLPATMGSIAEWQDFSRSEAKLPYRFQDRDATSVLTDCGW